jgi:hypothetical protein
MASNAKKSNKNDLLIYLYTEVKDVEMFSKYKNENIIKERLDLYNDFIKYLTRVLYDSYLGYDYINKKEDILSHYKWGFKKTCTDFNKFTINFYEQPLFDYLFIYFSNTLYNKKINNDKLLNEYFKLSNEYWTSIMTYNGTKNRLELDTMIDCYTMFNSIFDS